MGAFSLNNVFVTGEIEDISTASAVRIPIVDDMEGKPLSITGVLGGAITGSNAVITISKNGTSIGTITVAQSGSAEGDIDTLDWTGLESYDLVTGDYLKIATNGASTNTVPWGFTLTIRR